MNTMDALLQDPACLVLSKTEQQETIGGFFPPNPLPPQPDQSDLQRILDQLRAQNQQDLWLRRQRSMIQ